MGKTLLRPSCPIYILVLELLLPHLLQIMGLLMFSVSALLYLQLLSSILSVYLCSRFAFRCSFIVHWHRDCQRQDWYYHRQRMREVWYDFRPLFVVISWSPTIVLTYLMKQYNMTPKDALGLVIRTKPVLCPNAGFIKQLKDLDIKLHGACSLDIDSLPVKKDVWLALFA